MIILVLNCGSSSVKYQVMEMAGERHELLAKGLVERIGIDNSLLTHKPEGRKPVEIRTDIPDHTEGINLIIRALMDPEYGIIKSLDEISAVGHRVVHGGEFFKESALINVPIMDYIKECIELAPLHIPANLKGINAINELLPRVPQVAVFDTAFHQTMPPRSYIYGIPYMYYEKHRIRRFGFHGTSHRYVAQTGAALAGLDFDNSRIITCHIGNGASVAAILNGRSVDTSMGFTPVDGLLMGTRCGELDPGIIHHICTKEDMSIDELWNMINTESGVLGISGISSDMRDVENAAKQGNERAVLALDIYYYRIRKFVGAYAAALEGMDLLVFTGGVGENDPNMRETVCSGLGFMGVDFDGELNKTIRGKNTLLTKEGSHAKVAVIATNEELVIATDTFNIVSGT